MDTPKTEDRKIEDCYAIVRDGKAISVRFSHGIALAEATQKGGTVHKAKVVWLLSQATPPDQNLSEDTASQF